MILVVHLNLHLLKSTGGFFPILTMSSSYLFDCLPNRNQKDRSRFTCKRYTTVHSADMGPKKPSGTTSQSKCKLFVVNLLHYIFYIEALTLTPNFCLRLTNTFNTPASMGQFPGRAGKLKKKQQFVPHNKIQETIR